MENVIEVAFGGLRPFVFVDEKRGRPEGGGPAVVGVGGACAI